MKIRWITPELGTAAWTAVPPDADVCRIDVRDLVDRGGNAADVVGAKVEAVVAALARGARVVVCCDYGMSRSNAVAAGALSVWRRVPLGGAVREVLRATGESAVRVEVLDAVWQYMGGARPAAPAPPGLRVLVTGGSGFLGGPLVARLRELGHPVTAPTRQELDLTRDGVPLDLMVRETGARTLVHLANPRVYTTNESFGSSLVMLKTALDVCRQHRLRFVYLTSWEVYSGYATRELLADESLVPRPGGTYGVAKALGDQMVEHYRTRHGLAACCLRPGPVYGPSSDKPKFIWNFFEKARAGEPIVAHEYRNGYPALDLLHETDLRAALVAAIERPVEGWYHLGHGRLTSTTAIARHVIALTGSSSALRHHRLDADTANIALDARRAGADLEWRPTVGVEDGIAGMLDDRPVRTGRVPDDISSDRP